MKKNIKYIIIGLLLMTFLIGRNINTSPVLTRSAVDEYRVHNVGKVWTATSNFGNYGDPNVPEGLPSMEWPGGSGTHHLWEGRLWISALVNGEKRCSHADFGNYEFHPSDGSSFDLPANNAKSVEDSYCTFDDFVGPHTTTSLGLKINQRGLTWSTADYDDFVIYELEVIKERTGDNYSGDELSDLYISWVYDCDVGVGNDPANPHIDDAVDFEGWDGNNPASQITYREDIVENLDLDLDGVIEGYDNTGVPYAWRTVGSPSATQPNYDPQMAYPDGFYDEYTVYLSDSENAPALRWQCDAINADYTATAGEFAVIDGVELKGYIVPRNMSYMYDADDPTTPEDDTNEGGDVPGFIGGRLIYTDMWESGPYLETEDDTLMRVYSHQWWNWESDPATDRDKFDYATGTHIESRGNKFMPHPFDVGAPTFDYRFMLTTGPFDNVAQNDTIHLVYAAIVGDGIRDLRVNADNALNAYFAGSTSNPSDPLGPRDDIHYLLPVPPPVPILAYSPLNRGVVLSWDGSSENEVDPLVGAADFEGYRVYRATFKPGNWQFIGAFDNVDDPVHVLDFDTGDTLFNGQKFNLPNLTHSFYDTLSTFMALDENGNEVAMISNIERPINNLPYYYAVTAYDNPAAHGKPEFPPIESARVNYKTNLNTGAPEPVYPRKFYDEGEEWNGLEVSVYPNPYRGASFEESQYESKINFTNLPPACKVSIFSITGDLIKEIFHNDSSADESWDLASRTELDVVSGMYIYVVETELTTYPAKQIGKFVILRGN
jgi:hypothetical protein